MLLLGVRSSSWTRKDGSVRWSERDIVFPVSGDFDLGLERYYHSFDGQSSSLGRGWSLTPCGLCFAGTKRYYIFTKTEGTKVTHLAPYRVFVREGRVERAYVLQALDANDRPVLMAEASPHRLLYDAERDDYILWAPDRSQVGFDGRGRMQSMTDRSGNRLSSLWEQGPDGRLTAIEYPALPGWPLDRSRGAGRYPRQLHLTMTGTIFFASTGRATTTANTAMIKKAA